MTLGLGIKQTNPIKKAQIIFQKKRLAKIMLLQSSPDVAPHGYSFPDTVASRADAVTTTAGCPFTSLPPIHSRAKTPPPPKKKKKYPTPSPTTLPKVYV